MLYYIQNEKYIVAVCRRLSVHVNHLPVALAPIGVQACLLCASDTASIIIIIITTIIRITSVVMRILAIIFINIKVKGSIARFLSGHLIKEKGQQGTTGEPNVEAEITTYIIP